MAKWREHLRGRQKQATEDDEETGEGTSSNCYDLPCGMSFLRRWTFFKFVPFCPTFLADVKQESATMDDVEGAGVTVQLKAME